MLAWQPLIIYLFIIKRSNEWITSKIKSNWLQSMCPNKEGNHVKIIPEGLRIGRIDSTMDDMIWYDGKMTDGSKKKLKMKFWSFQNKGFSVQEFGFLHQCARERKHLGDSSVGLDFDSKSSTDDAGWMLGHRIKWWTLDRDAENNYSLVYSLLSSYLIIYSISSTPPPRLHRRAETPKRPPISSLSDYS